MGTSSIFIKRYHLLFLILALNLTLAQSGSISDKLVLLKVKDSIFDPSGVLSSWVLAGNHYCSWFGVSCDSSNRVFGLNLSGSGNFLSGSGICTKFGQFPLYGAGVKRTCYGSKGKLSGLLSREIGKLTELRVLSLPFNELSGQLPKEIMGLENLEVLDLEGNAISGSLPDLGGLWRLRVLNLGFNKIVGEIPRSLSNCVGLQVLNLAGNRINGTIPDFIGSFGDLREVYLSYNSIGGSVPGTIGDNCGKLEVLELSGNSIGGGIPSSLGKCRSLRSLILRSNLLLEFIPKELGQLSSIEVLDVSRNSLSGLIPRELGNCSNLSILVLSDLFDPFPNITNLGDFEIGQPGLDDEFNFFEGEIPNEITMLPKLKMIWAPRSLLQGRLPPNWGACKSLEMVNLGQNLFSGDISQGFSRCKNLHFLDLSSNRLNGEFFEAILVPCLTVLDVSENFLSGSIPRFNFEACSHTHSHLPNDLSAAYLSYYANKAKAKFSSTLIGDGEVISIYHHFGSNNFTGDLPSVPIGSSQLSTEKTIYAFLAGDNKLNGQFPGDLFQNCNGVDALIVNISDNQLSGQIPENISSICKSLKLLDASENQIKGIIPSKFGELVSLYSLDLSKNMLQGQIPTSLGQIKNLKILSLATNSLTGPIPTSFGQLGSLQVLDLSSNFLSGEIPKDLANLTNLTVLLLDSNNLLGEIPSGLSNVKTLSTFNVSFNNLSGPLLSKENLMKCNNIQGNPYLQSCRMFSLTTSSTDPQVENDPQNDSLSPSTTSSKSNGFNSIEIASVTSASTIVLVLIALVILFFYTRKWNSRSRIGGSERKEVTIFTDIGHPLTFEDVVRATGSFNASNCIGSGGFGATYKAEISPNLLVAIKRLSVGRCQGVQQFEAEIKTLGRLRHPNLVTLIGYHASETEMFLIYNYLPGGNLEKFIQERSTRVLDWRILHKIALDIARALAYLHDQCVPRVLHRDVKPSNILLDEDYNAYLSDFGLARLLGTSETHATTGVAGTFGYVAPEYAMTCRVSDKADVYSYGVVLLELLSDKKALDPSFSSFGNGFNIVQWSCMLLRQGRAKEFFTSGLWEVGPHDDLVEVLHLAVVCTVESLSTRPTMKQAVRRLKQLQPPSC